MKMVCLNADKKDLTKVEYKELRKCNCDRCNPVADVKELDILRAKEAERTAQDAAVEKGQEIAAHIIEKVKTTNEAIEEQVSEIISKKLEENGIDLNKKYTRDIIQKMEYSVPVYKNVYANTGFGRNQLSPEMKGFLHFMRTGEKLQGFNTKAMSEGVNSAGGFLVPEEFENEIIRKLANDVAIRRAGARVFTMNSNRLEVPVETARNNGGWIAEGIAYTEQDAAVGQVALTPYKYTRLVKVTEELLEDSAVDLANYLRDVFAEDFAEAEDKAFLEGSGTNQPTGILTDASITENDPTNVAFGDLLATVGADDIITHFYSLKAPYRRNAVWIMNSTSATLLRKMKDGNGQYIWTESAPGGIANGEPASLLGRPVIVSDNISDDATDGNQIVLGDFRYYMIGQRRGITIMRSDDFSFNTGHTTFRASLRVDGKVSQAEAFKVLINTPV
jgi:HK97 family phage major capsid protein